jgi:hypothetical protein
MSRICADISKRRVGKSGKDGFRTPKFLNYATRSRIQGAFCFGNEACDDLTGWRQIND